MHSLKNYLFFFRQEELPSYAKRIFVSYSSKDREFVNEVKLHLDLYKNTGSFNYWIDLNLTDESEWNTQIMAEMEKANLLIMLLSPGYLSTSYIIDKEIPVALQYQSAPVKEKQVFWLLLKPCNYEAFPEISKYPVYPVKEHDSSKGIAVQKAISEYPNRDRIWVELLKFILDDDI